MKFHNIFLGTFFFSLPMLAHADSGCFDGFRVESIAATATGAKENSVDVSFAFPANRRTPPVAVFNSTIDITRQGFEFVLATAVQKGSKVKLCVTASEDIHRLDRTVKSGGKKGVPRAEYNLNSLDSVTISYLE